MYIKRILVAIALLGLVAMGIFSYFVYKTVLIPNTAFDQEKAKVFIPTSTNKKETLEKVADQKKYTQNIRPGRYILNKGMNNMEIIDVLRSKNQPVSVKFNNQERLENLASQVSKQIEADSLSLINAMQDSEFLNENDFSLSNALAMYIPNTYEFYWNTSAEEFRDRMKKEYERFWNERRTLAAENLGLTKQQVLS